MLLFSPPLKRCMHAFNAASIAFVLLVLPAKAEDTDLADRRVSILIHGSGTTLR